MSVATSQPPDATDQQGMATYFTRPTGGEWDRSPFLYDVMMQSNGNSRVPIAACAATGLPGQLAKGFASFPQGWVAGLLQAVMMQGLLGKSQEAPADIRNQQLAAIIWAALQDKRRTYRVLRWLALNVLPKDAVFIGGRLGGSFFTAYALRMGSLPFRLKLAGSAANFALASYGSAILAISSGDRALHSILYAILSGRADGSVCVPEGKMLRELKDMNDKDGADVAPMVELLKNVLQLAQTMGAP